VAREHAERALALIVKRRPVAYWTYHGVAAVVEVFLTLWQTAPEGAADERGELGRLAARACKRFWVFAQIFPFSEAAAWLFQGHYERLAGGPVKARRAFTKAIAGAERLGMPYERAQAHLELGRLSSGHERTRNLMRAVEFFAEVSARSSLAQAQAELERASPQADAT
jgi:eukaryotic-like serine/threonine-protein kinase